MRKRDPHPSARPSNSGLSFYTLGRKPDDLHELVRARMRNERLRRWARMSMAVLVAIMAMTAYIILGAV